MPDSKSEMFGQKELFYRNHAEVHMLIDYISGRADKSLTELKEINGYNSDGTLGGVLHPQQVIAEICKISYPPTETLEVSAQQAALLLVVKDKLNFLAQPARGLTIAFSSMFAGVSLQYRSRFFGGIWRWIINTIHKTPSGEERKSDYFSAKAAYPNLESHARRFKRFYGALPTASFFLVAVIGCLNYEVSVTSTVMQQIATADAEYAKLFGPNQSFQPSLLNCGALDGTDEPKQLICDQAEAVRAQASMGRANLKKMMEQEIWYHPVAFGVRLFGWEGPATSAPAAKQKMQALAAAVAPPQKGPGVAPLPAPAPPVPAPVESVQQAVATTPQSQAAAPAQPSSQGMAIPVSRLESLTLAVVGGINNIIIPTLFGCLGTLVGVLRSITTKMRESILAPRDHFIARIAIVLGLSAGLTVGLFFSATDPAGVLAKSFGSTISVSAAGLSFLAGLGAETFFTFLDGVLGRLMPNNHVENGNPSR